MTKGLSSFILPLQSNMIFSIIDPENVMGRLDYLHGSQIKLLQYFGLEDSVFNHLSIILNQRNGVNFDAQKSGENLLNKRQFTVQCIKPAECLSLSMQSLDRMKKDF